MSGPALNVRKVGFLGSSTFSMGGVPIGNPDWEIWATGPGLHNNPDFRHRFTRWFELHNMADNDPQYGAVIDPGYYEWLAELGKEKPVYYRPPLYGGLPGFEFPWDDIYPKHAGYFLDSTVAWMMAFLYEKFENIETIGLWGIDFATEPERIQQRKGTKHFIELFRMRGVDVIIPPESEMIHDPVPYPDESPMAKKIRIQMDKMLAPQRKETEKELGMARDRVKMLEDHLSRIKGTEQTLRHFKDNWT